MQIKLLKNKDALALAEIAGLQDYRSLAGLIVAYIKYQPPDTDTVITISKSLLSSTYCSNPSMLGICLLNRLRDIFNDSSGTQDHQSEDKRIIVTLLRERKPFNGRWTHAKPTAKQTIKEWLALNLPVTAKLKIPIAAIAKTYQIYPAQLLHQIFLETGIRIQQLTLTKSWLITRK